ncbi:MAG: DUF4349 domain-containing protein [Bacteroidota bacterium]
MEFRSRIKRAFVWLTALFLVMFVFRLIYGFQTYPTHPGQIQFANFDSFLSGPSTRMNIASSKYEYKNLKSEYGESIHVDQKYEKIANLSCRTTEFEEEEAKIKATIDANQAIIQFQQKSGNKGNQQLSLQIGVPPSLFDTFIETIQQNHQVVSVHITKKDKTNEYRELNSKLATLKETRQSLLQLKSKGGKIEEYIQLENRILQIDEQLQGLGVQLGNFDSENEFCTVNLSLIEEGKPQKIGFVQRMKVALEWTIKYYLMTMAGLFFALGVALVLIMILDKMQVFARIRDRLD